MFVQKHGNDGRLQRKELIVGPVGIIFEDETCGGKHFYSNVTPGTKTDSSRCSSLFLLRLKVVTSFI